MGKPQEIIVGEINSVLQKMESAHSFRSVTDFAKASYQLLKETQLRLFFTDTQTLTRLNQLEPTFLKEALRSRLRFVLFYSAPLELEYAREEFHLDSTSMISADTIEALNRISNAHKIGAQEHLIANASVSGDTLLVRNCAGLTISVPFADVPALRKVPEHQRSTFAIERFGSRLSWMDDKVELDFDGLRYFSDPEYRKKIDHQNILRLKNYGTAIKSLRDEKGIRQTDVEGYNERQIGRIERGEQAITAKALAALAKAHKLSVSEYVRKVASIAKSTALK